MLPCLIIVARDQPELLHALLALYGHEDGVEIRFDQRQGLLWTGPGPPAAPCAPIRTSSTTASS